VAAKTVIAVAPAGIASGYQRPPQIKTGKESVVHFEDTNPTEIVSTPGTAAVPSKSAFQTGLIVIRVRADVAYSAAAGAVQFI
jgi:hypothetical protein